MSSAATAVVEKAAEVRAEFEGRGFTVVFAPRACEVPFDLHGLRPALLMRRGDEHLLVDIRASATQASFDLLDQVAEEVGKHRGWHLLLVTADDVPPGAPGIYEPFASWSRLRRRVAVAIDLATADRAPEVALLALWAALEGVLRRVAQRLSLPVERMPTPVLLPQLHAYGGLRLDQYEVLVSILPVRDRLAYGYDAPDGSVEVAVRTLVAILPALLPGSAERAA